MIIYDNMIIIGAIPGWEQQIQIPDDECGIRLALSDEPVRIQLLSKLPTSLLDNVELDVNRGGK